jgi:hypothetical protein
VAAIETSLAAFDLGRVVRRTFGALGRNPLTFTTLAMLYGVPRVVLSWINIQINPAYAHPSDTNPLAMLFAGFAPQTLLVGLVIGATSAFAQATISYGVVTDLNGRRPTTNECMSAGFRVFVPVVIIGFLLSWGTTIGLILLLVPGCILAAVGIVALTTEVVERPGVLNALLRSRDLTRGSRWAIFSLMVVFMIAIGIVQAAVTQVTIGIAAGTPGYLAAATRMPNLLASDIVGMLTIAVASAGAASIYYELRTIKEGAAPSALAAVFD